MGPLPKNNGPNPKSFWFWRGLPWGPLSPPPPLGHAASCNREPPVYTRRHHVPARVSLYLLGASCVAQKGPSVLARGLLYQADGLLHRSEGLLCRPEGLYHAKGLVYPPGGLLHRRKGLAHRQEDLLFKQIHPEHLYRPEGLLYIPNGILF